MPDTTKRAPEISPALPETRPEQAPPIERIRETASQPSGQEQPSPATAATAATPAAKSPEHPKDPFIKKIDAILEEDLGELYFKMNPDEQRQFKKKGEETTSKIKLLMEKTSVQAKEILKLIVEWLKLIPGVNSFFLEQEAKIKTDKILQLKK